MNVVLISTYELGRQPWGVASPAAWLRRAGCSVTCFDTAVERLREDPLVEADLVAFYVPMHTAARLACRLVGRVRRINPRAHICFYGLYAPVNETHLRGLGANTILGGEFESGLVSLARRVAAEETDGKRVPQSEPTISLERQRFLVPDRSGLPPLDGYAKLRLSPGDDKTTGYTEASRGCKHLCRHCPIVPVYDGTLRIVQRDVVLEDIRQQAKAGARHITFGDPDFLNGPRHAVAIVEALHRELPELTYDVTIKVEHLLRHRKLLPVLRETGCVLVTSAVESVEDRVLELLRKDHTREGFFEAVRLCREIGIDLNPTFVAFTPWTTLEGYVDLLQVLVDLDLVEHVAPVQYGIRLLIPAFSRLLELDEVRGIIGDFDEPGLVYPWSHPDPRTDRLCDDVMHQVKQGQRRLESRRRIFARVWRRVLEDCKSSVGETLKVAALDGAPQTVTVPYLTEPWYC